MSNRQLDMSLEFKRKVTSDDTSMIINNYQKVLNAMGLPKVAWGKSVAGAEELPNNGALASSIQHRGQEVDSVQEL